MLSGEQGTPRKVIVFSRDEAKQHEMRLSYLNPSFDLDDDLLYIGEAQYTDEERGDAKGRDRRRDATSALHRSS